MSEYVRCPHPKIRGEAQSSNALCWLASYTTLFRWKGMDDAKIKSHVLETLDGAGVDIAEAQRGGLQLKDNRKAANALGLGGAGYGQPVTLYNLKTLVRNSPVWATGQWFQNSNHVYVIVGVSDTYVEYYDPWYDAYPSEAMELRKTSLEWILQGNGKDMKGLAHTFQWFPLQFHKQA